MGKKSLKVRWRSQDTRAVLVLVGFSAIIILAYVVGIGLAGKKIHLHKPIAHARAEASETHPEKERMNFDLPLVPFSDTTLKFSAFSNRKLLIFYFSATCTHCQEALPQIQAFGDEVRKQGYETIAIANQASSGEEIRKFINRYRCRLPVFWDEGRLFGGYHGLRVSPTVFLVFPKGNFIRHENFSGEASLEFFRKKLSAANKG